MPEYNFTTLSPKEFETLSRDLLQAELGIRFETFTAGRDNGIDARWSNGLTDTIIIQCKHYAGSGYPQLLRTLKKEIRKIKAQQNLRYILTTSVGLTPANKDEILKTLHPYCCSTSDIYGRDDLNNLLSLHPQIEQQNFKLWLTSEAVLSRMLNAGILNDSASALDKARKRVQRYVQNNSFQRAVKVIEERGVCIIAGIPGIGKTTLAEVLLTYYVDKYDYNAFCIREDISDIKSIKQRDKKQIFYYDDFLGTTNLNPLRKNEDKRIVDFIEEVRNNKDWIFILTTREYIFQSAKLQYESLSQFPFDLNMCTISLDDYTATVKAEILYNHIYFSDIPTSYKLSILGNNNYEKILRHNNYNPRLIEHMTSFIRLSEVSNDNYVETFLLNLDSPTNIWRHAFEYQINNASKHLLMVLASMPKRIFIEHLNRAFLSFHQYRRNRYGFVTSPSDFNDALKLLDGNFIKTYQVETNRKQKKIVIEFHNPSVQDFLQVYLKENEDDVCDLIKSAIYFEQYEELWSVFHSSHYSKAKEPSPMLSGIVNNYPSFLDGIQRTLDENSCKLKLYSINKNIEYWVDRPTFEQRVLFLIDVTSQVQSSLAKSLAVSTINRLKDILLEQNYTNKEEKEELAKIISRLRSIDILDEGLTEELYQLTRSVIVTQLKDLADYEALISFFKRFRKEFSIHEITALQSQFEEFCIEEVDTVKSNSFNGIDYLEDSAKVLREIAVSLDMIEPICIQEIDEEIQEKKEMDKIFNKGNDKKENRDNKKENIVKEYQLTFSETKSMFNRLLSDIELLDTD